MLSNLLYAVHKLLHTLINLCHIVCNVTTAQGLYKPDASLADIGETLVPSIGKAAVSKRFAKIRAIAENGENQSDQN